MKTISYRSAPLRGEVSVPGDKSISHRAVMLGSIARGNTEITGFLSGADCLSTVDCFRRLGVDIDVREKEGQVTVRGRGLRGLRPGTDPVDLYTGNSGTTTRIISGILAPQPFTSVISGDASICTRPMRRIIQPLSLMGASIESVKGNDCAPLRIEGCPLHGITYHSPVASAQVKSSILCAGLYADGACVDSFEESDGWHARTKTCGELTARKIEVPGDISSAAYFIAAASIVPGSEVLIRNVGINPTRAGMIDIAVRMGADITMLNIRDGAEVADAHEVPQRPYGVPVAFGNADELAVSQDGKDGSEAQGDFRLVGVKAALFFLLENGFVVSKLHLHPFSGGDADRAFEPFGEGKGNVQVPGDDGVERACRPALRRDA